MKLVRPFHTFSCIHVMMQVLAEQLAELEWVAERLCSLTVEWGGTVSNLTSLLGSAPAWPALTSLSLTHCSLTSLSPALATAPNLSSLDCSHNQLAACPGLDR